MLTIFSVPYRSVLETRTYLVAFEPSQLFGHDQDMIWVVPLAPRMLQRPAQVTSELVIAYLPLVCRNPKAEERSRIYFYSSIKCFPEHSLTAQPAFPICEWPFSPGCFSKLGVFSPCSWPSSSFLLLLGVTKTSCHINISQQDWSFLGLSLCCHLEKERDVLSVLC